MAPHLWRRPLLLLLLALTSCAAPAPYATMVGILKPGSTMAIRIGQATLNVDRPSPGQPHGMFTIAATARGRQTPPPAPLSHVVPRGVVVTAPNQLAALSVRVPDGVNLVVDSRQGDVNVVDITGSARVAAGAGNVRITLPGYAQATVEQGNLSVTMGSTDWPGMLRFRSGHGDIVLWISPKAAFNVHLHTGDGTLVTDFALQATSQGPSETIDGSVNGGGGRAIDAQTSAGTVRLLRLPRA